MLRKTKVRICRKNVITGEDILVNERSQIRGGHGVWDNPIEVIPMIGDLITLDHKDIKTGDITTKTYTIISKEFKAKETTSFGYEGRECIIRVEELFDIQ